MQKYYDKSDVTTIAAYDDRLVAEFGHAVWLMIGVFIVLGSHPARGFVVRTLGRLGITVVEAVKPVGRPGCGGIGWTGENDAN